MLTSRRRKAAIMAEPPLANKRHKPGEVDCEELSSDPDDAPEEDQQGEEGDGQSLNEHLYKLFIQAQQLEDVGEAMQCYEELVSTLEQAMTDPEVESSAHPQPFSWSNSSELDAVPPPSLVGSWARNAMGGHYLDIKRITASKIEFEAALCLWPQNMMALLNLANLEREYGDPSRGIELYTQIAEFTIPHMGTETEELDWASSVWETTQDCISTAAYVLALVLHQHERYQDALP